MTGLLPSGKSMDTVYITCIIYLWKGETEFYLGKHICFVCVCVTCCSPQQGHLCARFALGAALGHLANGLFRNWESQTHQTHFKLAYIDLALNHFEPSWLWIHTREKHKSTPKEHQNSLRKFGIWGSQFSELWLWPWWMILQQSQIHFFIFYQSELSQVFHWLGPHPFKVQSLWVLAAIMSLDLEINMRSECTGWRPWNHCAILRPYEGICWWEDKLGILRPWTSSWGWGGISIWTCKIKPYPKHAVRMWFRLFGSFCHERVFTCSIQSPTKLCHMHCCIIPMFANRQTWHNLM